MKTVILKLVFFLVLFQIPVNIFSQDIKCEYLTVEDGLSNNSILDIYQDSSGFIWVGTENGLNRYDGFTIRNFRHIPGDTSSISNNAVSSFCLTQGDDFFAGTFSGINYYHADREVFERIHAVDGDGIIDVKVYEIIRTDMNEFLAATLAGLFLYDQNDHVFRPYRPNGLPGNIAGAHITSLMVDDDGLIWIGTHDNGVHYYDPVRHKSIELTHYIDQLNTFRANKIIHINFDSNNNIWLATNKGVYIFNKENYTIRRYLRNRDLSENGIADISALYTYESRPGEVWVLTRNGLSVYHASNDRFSHYFYDPFDNYSISSNVLNVMFKDRQDNIWIGTQLSGLNIIKQHSYAFREIISYKIGEGVAPNDFILSILEDREQRIWLGTYGSGINVADFQNDNYFNIQTSNTPGLNSNHIQTLMQDANERIWVGTYLGGITVMDLKTGKNLSYMHDDRDTSSLVNDIVNHIIEDSKNRIWIASHGGLSRYEPATGTFVNYSEDPEGKWDMSFATHIDEDDEGNLWVSSFNGLFRFEPKSEEVTYFKNSAQSQSLSDNFVFCIYSDHKNRIWAGTLNGLNMYDPEINGFKHYNLSDGLPDNSIYTIIGDFDGNLWLATNYGLSKFNPDKNTFINFNRSDGMIQDVFYYNSALRSRSGELYFGSRYGVVYFNPREIEHMVGDNKQTLQLTGLKVFDKYIKPGENTIIKQPLDRLDKLNLNYDESYISIEFSTFNYVNQNAEKFSYYLEGYDYDWVDLKNNHYVTFTKIPPGKYTLHIKAENSLLNISKTRSLDLIIHPPIWRSKASYIIYALVSLFIIGFIYSFFRSRAIYRNNLLIEKIEKEKNSEIYQSKIRFFINAAHEFKTPLTLILSPLKRLINKENELDPSSRLNLTRLVYKNAFFLSRMVNQIMDLRRIDAGNITLKAQEVDIVAFLNEASGYFNEFAKHNSREFEFHSDITEQKVWIDPDKMEKIIMNLISNAFNYTSEGGRIDLRLKLASHPPDKKNTKEIEAKYISLAVSDSGKGIAPENRKRIFERFYQIDDETKTGSTSSGIGLSIVKEYVELHNGYIDLESELGVGSTFKVFLPLGNSHLSPDQIVDGSEESFFKDQPDPGLVRNGKNAIARPLGSNPKILIVEDNDELRNYIIESLYMDFDVYEAADGEEGFRLANEILPELIVSDVMMPKMTGFELCTAIRQNLITSHIPIILLTVLESSEDRIEGFEEGADDYLNKPFEMDVLTARIHNLIKSRNLLRSKYANEVNAELNNITRNSTDRSFVSKATSILADNLSNIDFTAEEFSREIGMSRSNLHLKIKALTNQSTTEFIRTYRLKEAGKLLRTNDYNISEVAYQVGFNNISYFNRCFKKLYNITPSQFLEEISQHRS